MESANTLSKRGTQRVDLHAVKSAKPTRKLVVLIDAIVKVTGKYSGREYIFSGAGSVQDVNEEDVNWMLEKRQGGRQCCGGKDIGNQVFALAEE